MLWMQWIATALALLPNTALAKTEYDIGDAGTRYNLSNVPLEKKQELRDYERFVREWGSEIEGLKAELDKTKSKPAAAFDVCFRMYSLSVSSLRFTSLLPYRDVYGSPDSPQPGPNSTRLDAFLRFGVARTFNALNAFSFYRDNNFSERDPYIRGDTQVSCDRLDLVQLVLGYYYSEGKQQIWHVERREGQATGALGSVSYSAEILSLGEILEKMGALKKFGLEGLYASARASYLAAAKELEKLAQKEPRKGCTELGKGDKWRACKR